MNIEKEILKGHNRTLAEKIARYASKNSKQFNELMNCFLSKNFVLAQRAAWSLGIVARMQPTLVTPYLNELVNVLSKKDVHNALIRNSLQILESIDIPKKHQGKVMQQCFKFLENHSTPIAAKSYSLTILYNLSKIYPEIKGEIKALIESKWEHETPAFKSRGRKILGQLKKN